MKVRRLVVTLELSTDLPLAVLRAPRWWQEQGLALTSGPIVVHQAQANTIKLEKPAKKKSKP